MTRSECKAIEAYIQAINETAYRRQAYDEISNASWGKEVDDAAEDLNAGRKAEAVAEAELPPALLAYFKEIADAEEVLRQARLASSHP